MNSLCFLPLFHNASQTVVAPLSLRVNEQNNSRTPLSPLNLVTVHYNTEPYRVYICSSIEPRVGLLSSSQRPLHVTGHCTKYQSPWCPFLFMMLASLADHFHLTLGTSTVVNCGSRHEQSVAIALRSA